LGEDSANSIARPSLSVRQCLYGNALHDGVQYHADPIDIGAGDLQGIENVADKLHSFPDMRSLEFGEDRIARRPIPKCCVDAPALVGPPSSSAIRRIVAASRPSHEITAAVISAILRRRSL
jgi:hypothetical protein